MNKIEEIKLRKDGLDVLEDIHRYAANGEHRIPPRTRLSSNGTASIPSVRLRTATLWFVSESREASLMRASCSP
jgi:hypothetical protein